jgi:transcriptional regulator with XRE-family HTH domain
MLYASGMSVGSRIREARKRARLTQAALATTLRITSQAVSQWERDETAPETDNLRKLASRLGTTADWLMGRADPQDGEPVDINHVGYDIRDSVEQPALVPEIDVRAGGNYAGGYGQEDFAPDGAGHAVVRDAIRSAWGIPIPFLREELRARPDRVHIVPIRGDSMQDALFDGDRAMIHLDDTDVSQGGIFALIDDIGSLIIKQVELVRSPGDLRTIRCTSRNKNYAPFDLVLDGQVRIIGRVACKITRL